MSMARSVSSQSTPAVTWAPWKPVSVKNDEPNRLVRMVSPSCTNDVNSKAWKPRKVVPSRAVMNSHSLELPRIFSPSVVLGWSAFSTAARASTMASDDMSSTKVEAEVTGMLRIGLSTVSQTGGLHTSCGNGPVTLRPL